MLRMPTLPPNSSAKVSRWGRAKREQEVLIRLPPQPIVFVKAKKMIPVDWVNRGLDWAIFEASRHWAGTMVRQPRFTIFLKATEVG
jgi:hypothetical protein